MAAFDPKRALLNTKMIRKIALRALFSIFMGTISCVVIANDYPNLNTIEIGQEFKHSRPHYKIDSDRPTTQFNVPNYGDLELYFQEYEVVVLNTTNEVVIVSAKTAIAGVEECRNKLEKLRPILLKRFNGYILTEGEDVAVQSPNTYVHKNENTYYNINCVITYGPFYTLRYELRGKVEDTELKSAWQKFFEKTNRK